MDQTADGQIEWVVRGQESVCLTATSSLVKVCAPLLSSSALRLTQFSSARSYLRSTYKACVVWVIHLKEVNGIRSVNGTFTKVSKLVQ